MSANDKPPSYEEATMGESSSSDPSSWTANTSSWTANTSSLMPSESSTSPGPSCSSAPPPASWAPSSSSSWMPSCPTAEGALPSFSHGPGCINSASAPPPAGWAPMPLALVVSKEKEALANLQTQENNNNAETYPNLPEKCPQPNVVIPPAALPSQCPPGLEPLMGVTDMLLRENFVPHPRGGSRRGAVLLRGEASLLMVQRCPSVHHHRHAPRALELVDSSGGSVIARLESTKRGDLLSAEVQCPPGNRVSRAELRPGPVLPQLTASVLSADEKTALRVPALPPLGQLETQPVMQVQNAAGESSGALQWAWSTDADLMQVQIQIPPQTDVRIKVAVIALALLCMEAFSSRWSRAGDGQPRSLHRLHVRGHRKRHR